MADLRRSLQSRLRTDLDKFETLGHLDPVSDGEIERLVDDYADEFDIETRCVAYGEEYVVAHLLFRLFVERSLVFAHPSEWTGAETSLLRLAAEAELDAKTRAQVESIVTDRSAPDGYADLLPGYLALADDVLADPRFSLDGDRQSDAQVDLTVEHDGEQFETTLDASSVDATALVDLLNRVVVETTAEARRYAVLDTYRSTNVSVFFTHDPKTLDNYFSFARESAARQAETFGE